MLTQSYFPVSSEDCSAKPLFEFYNFNVMKCNNGVRLEKETRLFCHPRKEDWYSFPWSMVEMMIRRAFTIIMSKEDETLDGFHLSDDFDSRIHQ